MRRVSHTGSRTAAWVVLWLLGVLLQPRPLDLTVSVAGTAPAECGMECCAPASPASCCSNASPAVVWSTDCGCEAGGEAVLLVVPSMDWIVAPPEVTGCAPELPVPEVAVPSRASRSPAPEVPPPRDGRGA